MLTIVRATKTTDFPSQWDAWTSTGQYLYLRYRSSIGSVHQQPGPFDTHADQWDDDKAPIAEFGEPGTEYEITLEEFCAAAGLQFALDQPVSKESRMRLFLWILASWHAVGALMVVANVGKPKKPTTGGVAAVVVLIEAAITVGLILVLLRLAH